MLNFIKNFFNLVKQGKIVLYNEASLQYELAIYLRKQISLKQCKIELERNISHFGFQKGTFRKSEIDIVVYNKAKKRYIIELKAIIDQKLSRPVSVFNWIEDIYFLEQISKQGFECYTVFVTNQSGFRSGRINLKLNLLPAIRSNIFSGTYLRKLNPTPRQILTLNGSYNLNWKNISYKNNGMYYESFQVP